MTYKEYQQYLKSDYWRNIRRGKIKNRPCQVCGRYENLHLHHLKYKDLGNENLGRLRIVCKTCHKIIHKIPVRKHTLKYIYWKRYFLGQRDKIPLEIRMFLDDLIDREFSTPLGLDTYL